MRIPALKALAVSLLVSGIFALGLAAPASAIGAAASATMTVTSFTANTTVATDVTLNFSDPSAGPGSTYVQLGLHTLALPTGCPASTTTPSDCGISAITVNGSPATGTTITKLNAGMFKVELAAAATISSMSITFTANQLTVTSGVGNSSVDWQAVSGGSAVASSSYTVIAGGGGGGDSMVSFTGTGSLVDASSNAVSNFSVSSPVPAFTATASGFTNSATYSRVGVIFLKQTPTEYFSLTNTVSTSATPGAWSPGAATCGVTAIALGGVAQTGSSGINCQKETWTFNGASGYAIRLFFPVEESAALSVSVAGSVFTSGTAGNYVLRLAMSSATVNGSYFSGGTSVPVTVGGSSSSTPAPAASLSMGAATGGVVAGSSVAIQASGLQSTASYTVTVQSTPQVIGSGNAVAGVVNSSVIIPAGLEPGWHTLTFTSTAADGSSVVSKVYFEISSTGTLLSNTTTIPEALANTGSGDSPLSDAALMLLVAGIYLLFVAHRRRLNS